ncbi:MAG: alpha/beta fold hydrolase [Clostridia bacterium]|nr:alpha/beta fold hydrolase [Clostridia bacterium]
MWWIILIIILAVLVIGGFAAMLFVTVPIAKRVYFDTLVRDKPDKWGRVCSDTTNGEQVAMWNDGCKWAEQNKSCMQEVRIENDGLKLYGEYYDFGGEGCVIILPGRCESLKYSYYFAPPYQKSGCNVLVIDTRAHGKSEGMYNTIGTKESDDLIKWVNFLEENYKIRKVYFHSICVGTSTAMIVMTSENCPKSVKGLVTEGCFVSFRECYRTHMIYENRPLFPVLDLVMLYIRRYAHSKLMRQAPIRLVKNIDLPILFLFGRQDVFSLPEKSKRLFAACKSENKKIVWFDKGSHSHLRINNIEKYDDSVCDFIGSIK